VRITKGLLCGLSGLYAGQRGHERVAVLLSALGRVELAKGDVEAVFVGGCRTANPVKQTPLSV
jgi:hypothetical protein